MSPNSPSAPMDDEHAALPSRVDRLERSYETLRRDVANEFKEMREDQHRQSDAIMSKIDAQSRDFANSQAEALRRGQFSISSTFKTLVGAGTFILALTAAGATALKAPIEADIARDRADIQELKRSYMSRDELMVRFGTLDRDIDRGAAALSKLTDAAVMKPELDYRLTVTGKQRDESFAAIDRRLDRLRGDLDKVDSKVVSRAENKDRWEAEDKRFDALERQFDEHIRAFNDRQQRRIDAMEAGGRK